MGKDRFFHARNKALFLTLAAMLMASCAMPKIIVLNDPLDPEEHINLGLGYERQGEHEAAMQQYRAASRRLPIAFLYMGNLSFHNNDHKQAEAFYKKAIRKTKDPRAYNNLAWLYYTTGVRLKKAETLARKAVELSPEREDFRDTLMKIQTLLR